LYLVGHQNGSFPDLGWHVEGEMGGIWLHPIKLLDGFVAQLGDDSQSICLTEGKTFTNYPFANTIYYGSVLADLEVERMHFVPDAREGMVVLYRFRNTGSVDKSFDFSWTSKVDLRPVWLGEQSGMIDQADEVAFNELTGTFTAKDQGNDWYAVWEPTWEFR